MLDLNLRKHRRRGRRRGQALVEFALTSLLFIFTLVSIIELGRMMHAYITLQHAARTAARYAVTGQWMEHYAADPPESLAARWDQDSMDPANHIYPCWPRFPGDPLGADPRPSHTYYEPYRNVRTCSVEETAVRSMLGMNLNPQAGDYDPEHYEIVVSGLVADPTPTEGTFSRGFGPDLEFRQYSDFYNLSSDRAAPPPGGGLIRGFAGQPNQKVVVQITYNLRMITPAFNRIVPYVRLNATAIMVNEPFGSTGFQRGAAEPPDLPSAPPLNPPLPPDLFITEILYTGPWEVRPDAAATIPVNVTNKGELDAEAAYTLSLYACPDEFGANPPEAPPAPQPLRCQGGGTPILVGSQSGTALQAGQSEAVTVDANFNQPALIGQTWHVYAWVDSGRAVMEDKYDDGDEEVLIDAKRETLNLAYAGAFEIKKVADFTVSISVDKPAPNTGDTVEFTITVKNTSPTTTVDGVRVYATLQNPGLTAGGPTDWPGLSFDPNQTRTFTLPATIDGTGRLEAWAFIELPPDVTDDTPGANQARAVVVVQGVDLSLNKEITSMSNNPPEAGDTVSYRITVSNAAGYSDATGVAVTDTLPDGVSLDGTPSASNGSCTASGNSFTCTMAVAAGGSETITYSATVNSAGITGLQQNTAKVTGADQDEADATYPSDSASFEIPPPDRADLGFASSVVRVNGAAWDGTTPVHAGDNVQIVLELVNHGADPTANISVNTNLSPLGIASAGSVTPASPNTFSQTGIATGAWHIGALGYPGSAKLVIDLTVASGASGKTLVLDASVAGQDLPDIVPGNNAAKVSIPVGSAVDIAVTETANPTTVAPGGEVTYTITARNNGPDAATNVELRDGALSNAINKGMFTVISNTASHGSFDATRWLIPTLNAGETATLTLRVRLASNPDLLSQLDTEVALSAVDQAENPITNNKGGAVLAIHWPRPIFANLGPLSSPIRWEETNSAITFSAGWLSFSSASASGGSTRYTNTVGATATFQFDGKSFTLYRLLDVTRGMMEVCIDAEPCQQVDNYSATQRWQQAVTLSASTVGAHTVTIRHLTSGKYLDIDAIELMPSTACGNIEWGEAPGGDPSRGVGRSYDWQPVKAYSAGSWGYLTSNAYGGSANDWGVYYPDGAPVNKNVDPATHWLMNCRAAVTRLDMRFDNMAPGVYTLYLAFMDNSSTAPGRLIDVEYTTGTATASLMDNFDIFASVGKGVYAIRTFDVTVSASGWITVTVRKDAASSSQAILSGIGLVYKNP